MAKFEADTTSGRIYMTNSYVPDERTFYGTARDKASAERIADILCRAYRANDRGHYTDSARLYAQADPMVRLSKAFAGVATPGGEA